MAFYSSSAGVDPRADLTPEERAFLQERLGIVSDEDLPAAQALLVQAPPAERTALLEYLELVADPDLPLVLELLQRAPPPSWLKFLQVWADADPDDLTARDRLAEFVTRMPPEQLDPEALFIWERLLNYEQAQLIDPGRDTAAALRSWRENAELLGVPLWSTLEPGRQRDELTALFRTRAGTHRAELVGAFSQLDSAEEIDYWAEVWTNFSTPDLGELMDIYFRYAPDMREFGRKVADFALDSDVRPFMVVQIYAKATERFAGLHYQALNQMPPGVSLQNLYQWAFELHRVPPMMEAVLRRLEDSQDAGLWDRVLRLGRVHFLSVRRTQQALAVRVNNALAQPDVIAQLMVTAAEAGVMGDPAKREERFWVALMATWDAANNDTKLAYLQLWEQSSPMEWITLINVWREATGEERQLLLDGQDWDRIIRGYRERQRELFQVRMARETERGSQGGRSGRGRRVVTQPDIDNF